MTRGAQCAEDGPFFATTPRAIIQNGIALDPTILITPDWLLIGLMLVCFFVLVLILVIGLVCGIMIHIKFDCVKLSAISVKGKR